MNMRIIQVAAELAPVAKVGGLGDVVYGLSKELSKKHDVEIFLPKYESLKLDKLENLEVTHFIKSYERGFWFDNKIWSATLDGIKVKLIEPLHPHCYFARQNIYGYGDDVARFAYFSRTVLEYLLRNGDEIDILHLHDWHTSLIATLLDEPFYKLKCKINRGVVLTIHNLSYQGQCSSKELFDIGLNGHLYEEKLKDPQYAAANLLKGGIIYSDAITTVSPTYKKEILTAEKGEHLENLLIENQKKLFGILNGLDGTWHPENDSDISVNYSPKNSIDEVLQAKRENKEALQSSLGLKIDGSIPLIGCVTRLTPQKGHLFIKHAAFQAAKLGAQFILLGTAPNDKIREDFLKLQRRLKNISNLYFHFSFDENLSRKLYASADFFLIPSLFEPCGLTQIISMRYGTIPIVHATGGLADSVFDGKNGYSFDSPTLQNLRETIRRALNDYQEKPSKIKKMVKRGIRTNFSWRKPAKKYLKIYNV